MEHWVIMESGHCLAIVVAPSEWDETKVLAKWLRMPSGSDPHVYQDYYAEKKQPETLKE